MLLFLQEYLTTVEEAASAAGIVAGMVESMTSAMHGVDQRDAVANPADEGRGYVDYQTNLVRLGKLVAATAQEMASKSTSDVHALGPLAQQLTRDYCELAKQARGAAAIIKNPEVSVARIVLSLTRHVLSCGRDVLQVSSRLKRSVQELGATCVQLVQEGGKVHLDPTDSIARRKLHEDSRSVVERIASLLAVLQQGAKGTQACINAAHTVSGIIGDLDTTIMFATAGTLTADSGDTFADHRSVLNLIEA